MLFNRTSLQEMKSWVHGVSVISGLLYFLASIGYVGADAASSLVADNTATQFQIAYAVLALLFVADAIFYTIEWYAYREGNKRLDEAFWANAINIFASCIYVVSAILYFYFPPVVKGELQEVHASLQSALILMASVLFLIDALLYNSAWYNDQMTDQATRENPFYFWAELFNTIPSLGYTTTVSFQLFSQLSSEFDVKKHRNLLSLVRGLNAVWDCLYALDAILVLLAWHHDWALEQKEIYSAEESDEPETRKSLLDVQSD